MEAEKALALAALAVAAALIVLHFCLPAAPTGAGVVVVKPAAPALYLDKGRDALDDELLHGMTGEVVRNIDANRRYGVRTFYGYTVLIHKDDIRIDTTAVEKWRREAKHRVAAPFVDVTASPDLHAYPPLATLPRGALLAVRGEEGEHYYRVGLADGSSGFARKTSLREIRAWADAGEEENRRRVVADALSYLGAPYRWGGKTPAGIDCSGLASMAYLLNGLAIYRNSRPQPGYPVALLHVAAPPSGGHTRDSLAGAKPGDLIYWQGHEGIYLGDGKYVHANATSYDVRVNSLVAGDADYREDLADPAAILAWGTAYPAEPGKLIVKELRAVADGEKGRYRFYAKAEGYAPTSGILYPEGVGEGKPAIAIANPRYMLYDDAASEHEAVPRHRYAAPGAYRPAIVLVNETGWRPNGESMRSEVFAMPGEVVVE